MTVAAHPHAQPRPLLQAVLECCALVGAAAAIAAGAERWLDPQSLALFFVPPIIIIASRNGIWTSILASFLSSLSLNFLFVEPRYTFVVARPQDAAALALFSAVAVLASAIAARARAAALRAEAHARQARLMQELATKLASCADENEVANAALETLRALTGQHVALVSADGPAWGAALDNQSSEAARWAMSTKQLFAPSPEAPVTTSWSFWPVLIRGRCVMAVGVDASARPPSDLEAALVQVSAQVGLGVERVRAAQAEQAANIEVERERLKSELLAGVSHDLRTPLSTIVLTLESLRKFSADHPPETRKELLELAEAEARRLAKLVEDLLDASRIGAGGAPVRIEPVAAEELIARARSDLDAGVQGCAVELHVNAGLPKVAADPALAARALSNVLNNAVRHGGGRVELSARLGDGVVAIEVRDHGPGLGSAPEKLFEPFVRGAETDGRAPGLGLGLALARSYLRSQGARITARNNPDRGATFTLLFPVAAKEVSHVG